jgi:hypothetical protein
MFRSAQHDRVIFRVRNPDFSKLVGHSAVEAATLAELRGPDSDAATVTQLIDLIENVDDIETDFEGGLLCNLDPARHVHVKRLVGMVLLSVCKAAA